MNFIESPGPTTRLAAIKVMTARRQVQEILLRCLAALLALCSVGGVAREPRLHDEFTVRVWNRSQSLPANTITALLQTRDGCLWVGTSRGLARFDGLNFTVFNHTTHAEFDSDSVRALAEDPAGRLWVGS